MVITPFEAGHHPPRLCLAVKNGLHNLNNLNLEGQVPPGQGMIRIKGYVSVRDSEHSYSGDRSVGLFDLKPLSHGWIHMGG